MSVRLSSSTSAAAAPAPEASEGQADPLAARQTKRQTPAQMQAKLKEARLKRDKESAEKADATAKTYDGAADAADKTGDTLTKVLAERDGKQDGAAAITDAQAPAETPVVDAGAPSDAATSALTASSDAAVDAPLVDGSAPATGSTGSGDIGAAISAAVTVVKVGCKVASTAKKMEAASDRGADDSAMAMTAVSSGVGVASDVATAKSSGESQAKTAYKAGYESKVGEYNDTTEQANALAGKVRDLDSQRATLVEQGEDTSGVDAELEQATAQHKKTSANRDHMVETAGKMAARSGHVTG